MRVSKFEHIRPVLMKLHWLPVKERVIFKIIIISFKILTGQAPHYLKDLVKERHISSHTLRSRGVIQLEIHLVTPVRSKQAFSVAAPTLWNALPKTLRFRVNIVLEKYASFKRNVKSYLFKSTYGDLM